MNRHVNAIAGGLSLSRPQRRSLEILDCITEIAPLGKGAKPWRYVLIPHDEIAENNTLDGLAVRFG